MSHRTLYRALPADSYTVTPINGDSPTTGPSLRMSGYLAKFDEWAEINSKSEGHFLEKISPGAFTKTLAERGNRIPVMFAHGEDPEIGSKVIGKVTRIGEDAQGVFFSVDLHRGLPQLLLEGLRAGSYGASFRGRAIKQRDEMSPARSARNPQRLPEVTLHEIALREFGPVAFPAYSGTSAEIRSLNDEFARATTRALFPPRLQLASRGRPSWYLGDDEEEGRPDWYLEREPSWYLDPNERRRRSGRTYSKA